MANLKHSTIGTFRNGKFFPALNGYDGFLYPQLNGGQMGEYPVAYADDDTVPGTVNDNTKQAMDQQPEVGTLARRLADGRVIALDIDFELGVKSNTDDIVLS